MTEHIEVFMGLCKNAQHCKCLTKSPYEIISGSRFYVYDPPSQEERPSEIVGLELPYHLTVVNTQGKDIAFIKTDNCCIPKGKSVKKCDCILLSSNKIFFVEIKSGGTGNRGDKRRSAVLQLGAIIDLFKSNGFDFTSIEAKAVICFKCRTDRPTQPSLNSKKAIFLQDYNVQLEEGNLIEF